MCISVNPCPGQGYYKKNWVGVGSLLPKTLFLFQTKLCDFPYPISDLTKNFIPYFRPCLIISSSVHKPYPISDQNDKNQYPILDQNPYPKKPIPLGPTHIPCKGVPPWAPVLTMFWFYYVCWLNSHTKWHGITSGTQSDG